MPGRLSALYPMVLSQFQRRPANKELRGQIAKLDLMLLGRHSHSISLISVKALKPRLLAPNPILAGSRIIVMPA